MEKLTKKHRTYYFEQTLPREMKSPADKVLENIIIRKLRKTGISICSEESGFIKMGTNRELRWLVDPLDGTVNFVRGLGNCGISIGLCHGNAPLWGVVGQYPSREIFWGGPETGAFKDGKPLRVSALRNPCQAVLCTGFPSRFKFNQAGLNWMRHSLASFGKIRMIGSASISLLQVAQGAAEAYSENGIMLWDVAAGLAIVQGAGGSYRIEKSRYSGALNIKASNGMPGFLRP